MDLKKTGALIAQCRKEQNLTQKELAELLGVTDKAISRWETGKGFPDASFLQPLAQVLGVSITEIVNGERTQPETAEAQADRALLSALNYTKKMSRTVLVVLLMIFGAGLALAPGYTTGVPADLLVVLGVFVLAAGAALLIWKKGPSRRTARLLAQLALVGALVLEILPGGAALVFQGPDYYNRELYSCFDLTLVGYANFAPFLAAVLTAGVTGLNLPILLGKWAQLRNCVFICTVVAGIFMLLPLILFGLAYMTASGLAIVLLLLFTAAGFQASAN